MQKGKAVTKEYKRGTVWWADLSNNVFGKHVEKGWRPYIIVSTDASNDSSPNVTVIPCSTRPKKIPTHTTVRLSRYNLCIAMCEQVVTVGKECFERSYGEVSKKEMNEIVKALKIHLGVEE